MQVVCASANPDKAIEIAAILGEFGIDVLPRPAHVADVVEDGDTLETNARLKAVAVAEAADAVAVADDTGLEVDALAGAPGVRSSRYAGEGASYADNVAKLLDAMAETPEPAVRTARFRTIAVARFPDGRELIAEGAVEGLIALGPVGTNGFGYDPVFIPDGAGGRTFAELESVEKDALSHRGRAFRALGEQLVRVRA
jgi:XTP/dITP diphosphohydrolase